MRRYSNNCKNTDRQGSHPALYIQRVLDEQAPSRPLLVASGSLLSHVLYFIYSVEILIYVVTSMNMAGAIAGTTASSISRFVQSENLFSFDYRSTSYCCYYSVFCILLLLSSRFECASRGLKWLKLQTHAICAVYKPAACTDCAGLLLLGLVTIKTSWEKPLKEIATYNIYRETRCSAKTIISSRKPRNDICTGIIVFPFKSSVGVDGGVGQPVKV